ncbi:MAG: 50S ribosomal protein L22 [Patescibacteria group bacterium]|nr:50S ribosomal protein L22 [Patescibacteria group bacterium]
MNNMTKIEEKNIVVAQLKYFRVSPRKVRPLLKTLKGKKATEVLAYLQFNNSRASAYLLKLFKSAISNAKNKGLEEEKLVVLEFVCDEGPVLKRFRAGHRGTALPYQRKLAHIKVVLVESKDEDKIKKIKKVSKIIEKENNNKPKTKEIAKNKNK